MLPPRGIRASIEDSIESLSSYGARAVAQSQKGIQQLLERPPSFGKTWGEELHHDKECVTQKVSAPWINVDLISVHMHFHKVNPRRLLFGDPIVQTENLGAFERIKIQGPNNARNQRRQCVLSCVQVLLQRTPGKSFANA